jgi:hypothetical protein
LRKKKKRRRRRHEQTKHVGALEFFFQKNNELV